METMVNLELSANDLGLLLMAIADSIAAKNETARKNAEWPEVVNECRKRINDLAYLAEDVRRAYNAAQDVTYIPA